MKGLIPVAQSVHLRYFYIFNIIMQELTDSEPTCPIHPQTLAAYYASDQPWVKFCGECALNLALSGKKIQKQLSAQQYDNKTRLIRISDRMKSAAKNADVWHLQLGKMAEETEEEGGKTLRKTIVEFNEYVNFLIRMREEIVETFEQNFGKKAQDLYERQTKVMLSQIELKKQIQYIQINFGQIVQAQNDEELIQKCKKWEKSIDNINDYILNPSEKSQLRTNMQQISAETKNKLSNIPPFKMTNLLTQSLTSAQFQDSQSEGRQSNSKIINTEKMHSRMSSIMSYCDQNVEQPLKTTGNRMITQLKLRSKSKKNEKKSEKEESVRKQRRSSIRQISNLIHLNQFHY